MGNPILEALNCFAAEQPFHDGSYRRMVVGMHLFAEGQRKQRLSVAPQRYRPRRVDRLQETIESHDCEKVTAHLPDAVALGRALGDLMLKPLVKLMKPDLRSLARRDVDGGADHAKARATRIEQAAPLRRNPADDTIFLAHGAIFDVVQGTKVGIARGLVSLARLLPIVWMNAVVEVVQRDRHVRRDAEHRLHPGRPEHTTGGLINVPLTDLGDFQGQAQLLFANCELLLRLTPLIDVDD